MSRSNSKSVLPLISQRHEEEDHKMAPQLATWRFNVRVGTGVTCVVFVINLGVHPVECHRFDLCTSSCSETKNITFWADLAINIFSTLLLGASNNCSQILLSPTREDIDKAHRAGKWLGVGVPSIRNFCAISRWRKRLCTCLLLSSIPMHLLYNSVLYSTLSANNYIAAVVTEDFLGGAYYNTSLLPLASEDESVTNVKNIQDNHGNFIRLENVDCIRAYSASVLQSDWRNVLLVADTNITGSSLTKAYFHHADYNYNDLGWICGQQQRDRSDTRKCDIKGLIHNANEWNLKDNMTFSYEYTLRNNVSVVQEGEGPPYRASVKYCMAERAEQRCTARISTSLLGYVVACNLVKLICLSATLLAGNFHPLATVGDFISSYMREPDTCTCGKGPISVLEVRKYRLSRNRHWQSVLNLAFPPHRLRTKFYRSAPSHAEEDVQDHCPSFQGPWKMRSRRWFRATSRLTWWTCIVLCAVVWSAGFGLLMRSLSIYEDNTQTKYSLEAIWAEGIGEVSTSHLIPGSFEAPLVLNALLANTPQIVLSFVYVCYNNVLTSMLLGHEYTGFAKERKALRVTKPSGQQRSTYWLQLPYKYSVPLMTSMAILLWLVARSIFLVQIDVTEANGEASPNRMTACGFSLMAIVLALLVGGIIILALLANGCRTLSPGMPLAATCSLAISAACHPPTGKDDAPLLPLKYGIAQDENNGMDWGGKEHVSFSSEEVTPLIEGHVYI